MKRRISYLLNPEDSIDPESVHVNDDDISGPGLSAVREERLTLSLDELPDEIASALKQNTRGLHVRWSAPAAYKANELFSSRVSPGLHVFYTPQDGSNELPSIACSLLEPFFGGLGCNDPNSFIELPSRQEGGKSFQYYQDYENLDRFTDNLRIALCGPPPLDDECRTRVHALQDAVSLDISYDSTLQALRISALWPTDARQVKERAVGQQRTEVGIFSTNPSTGDLHEIGISGFTIAAPDQKTGRSIHAFAVPSRHRQSESGFSAKFLSPLGLHPTLQLSITSPAPPKMHGEVEDCALHAYLTLPRSIFADRYQLADDLFMASKNLSSLRYMSHPVDLEMPAYKTPSWGSAVLLDLAPPSGSPSGSSWTAEIPLHLRYMAPEAGGYAEAQVPYPAVFWTCRANMREEDGPLSGNPFDRAHLGYDELFDPRTIFWHLEPQPSAKNATSRLINTVKVPVLAKEGSGWVELGTAATILVGFAWVLLSLGLAARAGHGRSRAGEKSDGTQRKKKQ